MNTRHQQDLDELRSVVRRFLLARSSTERLRHGAETGTAHDESVWRQMAEQLGLQGLPIPERYGGAGYSFVEAAVVLQEMGRTLDLSPFWSTTVAGQVILASGDTEAAERWLPRIADGTLIAGVAIVDDASAPTRATPARPDAASRDQHGSWTLTGVKHLVTDAGATDLLLVLASTENGVRLFAVDRAAEGLTALPRPSLDLSRPLHDVVLAATPARLIDSAADVIAGRVRDLAVVALAAEQAGAAQRCLEMAVDYAKTRFQFGRPIGSFQAIKHKCADMLLLVESAKAAADAAASAVAVDAENASVLAAIAGAYCSEALCEVAAENIQIHGGMGVTWEHEAHLYFRRAWSSRALVSTPADHRRRLASFIGL